MTKTATTPVADMSNDDLRYAATEALNAVEDCQDRIYDLGDEGDEDRDLLAEATDNLAQARARAAEIAAELRRRLQAARRTANAATSTRVLAPAA